ncbi:flagellar FlbD family protein [Mesobacillus maritimus]|uniref:flagellar FlbD family protein n=1 Tax=Mesobacillus maritimus TaxID=1643336 RepID=UPI0038514996
MIQLTRLNQSTLTLNAIYIERIESTPDTVITLLSGKKVHVLETSAEVTRKVTDFYQKINLLSSLQEPNRNE